MRKQPIEASNVPRRSLDGEIDCTARAAVGYSSEQAGHPVDNLFDGHDGPGGTRWISDRPDRVEHIVLAFDEPQDISRAIYEVEERQCARTQEVRVEVSSDRQQTYRQLFVQDYTFSPGGATFQKEDLRVAARQVTHLRVTVVPNKGGSGHATLTALRLFA